MVTAQNLRQRRKLARRARRRLSRYLSLTYAPNEAKAYAALQEAQAAIITIIDLTDGRSLMGGSRTTTNRNPRPR
jgi:hypothetical protein